MPKVTKIPKTTKKISKKVTPKKVTKKVIPKKVIEKDKKDRKVKPVNANANNNNITITLNKEVKQRQDSKSQDIYGRNYRPKPVTVNATPQTIYRSEKPVESPELKNALVAQNNQLSLIRDDQKKYLSNQSSTPSTIANTFDYKPMTDYFDNRFDNFQNQLNTQQRQSIPQQSYDPGNFFIPTVNKPPIITETTETTEIKDITDVKKRGPKPKTQEELDKLAGIKKKGEEDIMNIRLGKAQLAADAAVAREESKPIKESKSKKTKTTNNELQPVTQDTKTLSNNIQEQTKLQTSNDPIVDEPEEGEETTPPPTQDETKNELKDETKDETIKKKGKIPQVELIRLYENNMKYLQDNDKDNLYPLEEGYENATYASLLELKKETDAWLVDYKARSGAKDLLTKKTKSVEKVISKTTTKKSSKNTAK